MSRTRPLRSRQLRALFLGVCAALAAALPPLELTGRIDALLFDLWSKMAPMQAPEDLVIVSLQDAEWFSVLADIASRDQAKLLVTTLPLPPSTHANQFALGPTELSLGPQLIRRTDWLHGGHISFADGPDGLVRSLPPFLQENSSIPSLAVSAVQKLMPTNRIDADRTHIRFFSPNSFVHATPSQLQTDRTLLTNRIVVAGLAQPMLATTVGPLAEHELLAQVIAGYRQTVLLGTNTWASAAPWAICALALTAFSIRPRRPKGRLLAVGTALGLIGISGTGFVALGLMIPVAGPEIMLLTGFGLLTARRQIRLNPRAAPSNRATALAALADGRLEDAWLHFKEIPATRSSLGDLYDFGEALQTAGYLDLAADIFHRAAVIDPRFRDVAKRLVRANRAQSPEEDSETEVAIDGAELPNELGRYELLERIGNGSTGTVYLALDPTINRLVALKVINLRSEYDADSMDEGKDRFKREAETAGRLNHQNIVTMFDIGERDGLAFIAMEYLKGRHLSDFTSEDKLLPTRLVIELGAQMATALDYAHDRNVIHRDIKPANIMYDSVSGDLKITDFGIARLIDVSRTRTGIVLGTPSFMAPEQLEGGNVNRHTDLFALGVSLYELLTGRLPFLGASMTNLMFVIANEPHQPVTALRTDLPPAIDSAMDMALAKRPENRFDRGADMAATLRQVAEQMS
jgi:tRNA A-37 threonylcarbamoyl transferase component Bud32